MARVPSPAAAHIGERIRVARESVRMTHDQLAAATGIDSANIRSYESGRAMPSIHTLLRIALALGASPSDLLDDLTLDLFEPHGGRRAG